MAFRPESQIGVGGLSIGPVARKYIDQIIESNHVTYGPLTKEFEKRFADLHQCKHAIFTVSGTCALQLALDVMKEKRSWDDDVEVIVPAMTFIATVNAVLICGLKVVFCEVDENTCNMDPKKLQAAITEKTGAILPVHLFGVPCDMTSIMEIAEKHNLEILEDSCETMFAKQDGKSVGSFGMAGCFSTYAAHFLVTGVGGFVTTDDDDVAVRVRSLMNHGRDSIYIACDDDKNVEGEELVEIVKRRFNFVRLGYSYRLTEFEAALGLEELDRWENTYKVRKATAKFFIDKLAPLEVAGHISLPRNLGGSYEHSFMIFPVIVHGNKKSALVQHLEKKLIETRDLMPLLSQPHIEDMFGDLRAAYPVAAYNSENGFYLGCHQHLSQDEMNYMVEQIQTFYESAAAS